jgi:hypothetical protein
MLEYQQAYDHFGRRGQSTVAAALGASLRQSLVDRYNQLLVTQHLVCVLHPMFPQVLDLVGDQPVAKAELRPTHLNHGPCSGPLKHLYRRATALD